MSAVLGLLLAGVQLVLMLAVALPLAGLTAALRAWLGTRARVAVLQPWWEMVRLLRKEPVLPAGASRLFRIAPVVALAATLLAALLVPAFTLLSAVRPLADLLLVAGLLALARASLVFAGLEAGSALGGLGATRLLAQAVLAAPGLLAAVFALALLGGSSNLFLIAGALAPADTLARVAALLSCLALLPAAGPALASAAVFVPETGLVAEAVAYAYSGRYVALLRAAEALQRVLWLSLLADLALPFGLAEAHSPPLVWLLAVPVWGLKLGLGAAVVAVWQTQSVARRQEWLAWAGLGAALAGVAAVLLLCCFGQGGV